MQHEGEHATLRQHSTAAVEPQGKAQALVLVLVKVQPLLVWHELKIHGLPLFALLDLARNVASLGASLCAAQVQWCG